MEEQSTSSTSSTSSRASKVVPKEDDQQKGGEEHNESQSVEDEVRVSVISVRRQTEPYPANWTPDIYVK